MKVQNKTKPSFLRIYWDIIKSFKTYIEFTTLSKERIILPYEIVNSSVNGGYYRDTWKVYDWPHKLHKLVFELDTVSTYHIGCNIHLNYSKVDIQMDNSETVDDIFGDEC